MVQTGMAAKKVGADMAALLPKDGVAWYKKSHLVMLNFSLLSLILFSSSNGFDGSLMNGLQSLPQWQADFNRPTGAYLGFINGAMSLGAIVNYPALSWFVQKYGRKKSIWIGYFFLVLGTVLNTVAENTATFIFGRVFMGCGSAWVSQGAPLLITENAYPTQRGIMTALYNTQWYSGSIIAAWATFGTRNYPNSWSWRIPAILQILLPLVALPGYLMCPESPRWLVSVGRVQEAQAILTKYHAGGDENSALVAFEIKEIEETLALEREQGAGGSYLDLFSSKGNRQRAFISISLGIFGQWVGNGVASYYLSTILTSVGITSVTNQTLINGCLQIWNLIMAVGAALLVDKVGRRPLFLASGIGMLTSYILITALSATFSKNTSLSGVGTAVIPMLFLFYASYDIALTPLIVSYPAEIWPFANRARGLVATIFSTQVAVFFNIFINPIALDAISWKYYFVFLFVLVFMVVSVYFYYPETRGRSLEEIAVIFDGPNAATADSGDILRRVSVASEKNGHFAEVQEHVGKN